MNKKFLKICLITTVSLVVLSTCASNALALTIPPAQKADKAASRAAEKKSNAIDRLKDKADKEIDRRQETLNNILSKFGEAKKLTAADKTALAAQIQAEITDLTSLKNKIDADTDIATLRTDIKSIAKDYRVYALIAPKVRIILASDRIKAAIDKFNAYLTKLKFPSSPALIAIQAKITDALTQAQLAHDSIINITPDQFNADHKVVKISQDALKTARKDLEMARKDLHTLIASSSASASSSATTP